MRTVWHNTVDSRYECTVTSEADPYKGVLAIVDSETGNLIHSEPVGISFAAPFGPDVADVAEWEKTSIDVVDGKKKRVV